MQYFLEIITEESNRFYFPLYAIERLEIKGDTVCIRTKECHPAGFMIAKVNNIDSIVRQMDNAKVIQFD